MTTSPVLKLVLYPDWTKVPSSANANLPCAKPEVPAYGTSAPGAARVSDHLLAGAGSGFGGPAFSCLLEGVPPTLTGWELPQTADWPEMDNVGGHLLGGESSEDT